MSNSSSDGALSGRPRRPVPPRVFREWRGLDLRFESILTGTLPDPNPIIPIDDLQLLSSEGRKFYSVGAARREIWVLDLSQEDPEWTFLSRFPEYMSSFKSVKVGNKIMLVASEVLVGEANILSYNIDTNQWTRMENPISINNCVDAVAYSSHDALYVKDNLPRSHNMTLGTYNVSTGTSEILSVRMTGCLVRRLVNVGDLKVVAFVFRNLVNTHLLNLECDLIDISANKLIRLPPLLTGLNMERYISFEGVAVRNFLIVTYQIYNEYGDSLESFRLLDLERPSLGWHIIEGLRENYFSFYQRIQKLAYLEDEKCILGCSLHEVQKLDLSSVFETGTFKYKATIPSIARKEVPDGLLPHILACGNTLPQPDLNFQVLQSRMDVLCNVKPLGGQSRKRRRIEAARQDDTTTEEPVANNDDYRKMPAKTGSSFLSSTCTIS